MLTSFVLAPLDLLIQGKTIGGGIRIGVQSMPYKDPEARRACQRKRYFAEHVALTR